MPSTLSQGIYNSTLVFTSYWYRASRSARSESLRPSQVFLEQSNGPSHVQNPRQAYFVLDSQEYVRIFKSLYGHLIPQLKALVWVEQWCSNKSWRIFNHLLGVMGSHCWNVLQRRGMTVFAYQKKNLCQSSKEWIEGGQSGDREIEEMIAAV